MIAFFQQHYVMIPGLVFALALFWLALDATALNLIVTVFIAVWLAGAVGVWLKS